MKPHVFVSTIGHMKNDGRLGGNYLLGKDGDCINVLLSAAGYNLRLILAKLARDASKIFFFVRWQTQIFCQIAMPTPC